VTVLALDGEPCVDGVQVRRVEVRGATKVFRDAAFVRKSARLLASGDFDLVVGGQKALGADVVRLGGGVYSEYIKREVRSAGTPILRALRAVKKRLSVKEACNLWIERRMCASPRIRRVIVNSPDVKRALLRAYALPEDKVCVIYNGVDLDRYSPSLRERHREEVRRQHGLGDGEVILFMANNFRLKGLRCLVRAMAEVRERLPKAKALIVGKGRIGREKRFARRLGVEDAVVFAGPTREPERSYGAADVLAHPTFHDPCANVCMEALAAGVPVLTTVLNGMHELITPGREGYVLSDPRDTSEMAGRLVEMLRQDRWPGFARAAHELGKQYSAQRNYEQFIRVLEDVLREKRTVS